MEKEKKEIILGSALILLGIFCWYFIKYVFYVSNLSTACWISGIILFILWGVSLLLAMLLIENEKILYGSIIITLLATYIFFSKEPYYYLLTHIIFLLIFWRATKKIKKDKEIRTELQLKRTWKRGLPSVVTGIILIITMVYYFSPALTEVKQRNIDFPRQTFETAITPLEGLIEKRLPGDISLDDNADELLTQEQKEDLEKSYGVIVEKNDTGKDVLYKLINFQLNNATGPYRKFIPFGLAIGLFIGLKIVSIIYIILTLLIASIITKMLIKTKFINKQKIKKTAEIVTI
ncbi:MAG: hypothetical protein GF387_02205 [Candidatus Portnoybacteria bacterium]|nr:hypothetical protein [Candidatus Portnoybacteria bacterium]